MTDSSLSSLYPKVQIGSDGFQWWIGQIESTRSSDPKFGDRWKVRIIGLHPQTCDSVKSEDLPWAGVMASPHYPHNVGGITSVTTQFTPGCWVVGFFLDRDQQQPFIMGSVGRVPESKSEKDEELDEPDKECLSFTTYKDPENIRELEQPANEEKTFSGDGTGDGNGAETSSGDGNGAEPTRTGAGHVETKEKTVLQEVKEGPASQVNPAGTNICISIADKCGKETQISNTMEHLFSEMLYETQRNNGKLGDYLVGVASGKLYDAKKIGRKYINKAMRVIRTFIASTKGFVVEKIKWAAEKLTNLLLRPDPLGNSLGAVTTFFNEHINYLGCAMASLEDRLSEFLEELIFGYLFNIYKTSACQVDKFVQGLLSKINSMMQELLEQILGPLQAILGAIAGPLNMIGEAINYVLNLLGIQCNGPDNRCNKVTSVSTKCETDKRKDFLDDLLDSLQDPWDGAGYDWSTYTCEEAYEGVRLKETDVTFVGGKPVTDGSEDRIIYQTFDTAVTEGDKAKILVRRSGKIDIASSIFYRTIEGTAEFVSDFLETTGTLGFSPGETEKEIEVQTVYSDELETSEDFFVVMRPGTPGVVARSFTKSIARIVINKSKIGSSADPDLDTDDTPTRFSNPNDPNNFDFGPVFDTLANDNDSDTVAAEPEGPTYKVTPDKASVKEGEFVTYLVETTGVENGTLFQYQLFGDGIINSDIVGGNLLGQFVVENNKSLIVVGIEDDSQLEDRERLILGINGTDASATVIIESQLTQFGREDLLDEVDESVLLDKDTVYQKTKRPVAGAPITDPGGGIIEVPITNPGTAYTEPPAVLITGQGYGAVGIALLDKNNQVSEIRVTNPGFGYKLNVPETEQKRCIIDSFTMLSPGTGYISRPVVYVNGDSDVAEAVIENGMVVSVRIKNRERVFNEYPRVQIIGGGGYGARWIPSFKCLSTEALVKVGSAKIGTGSYIDCP